MAKLGRCNFCGNESYLCVKGLCPLHYRRFNHKPDKRTHKTSREYRKAYYAFKFRKPAHA